MGEGRGSTACKRLAGGRRRNKTDHCGQARYVSIASNDMTKLLLLTFELVGNLR